MQTVDKMDEYELQAFIFRLGSFPKTRLFFENRSGGYQKKQVSVWKLENGRYAVISELGCSCYTPDRADIPTKAAAQTAFEKWKRENPADAH